MPTCRDLNEARPRWMIVIQEVHSWQRGGYKACITVVRAMRRSNGVLTRIVLCNGQEQSKRSVTQSFHKFGLEEAVVDIAINCRVVYGYETLAINNKAC